MGGGRGRHAGRHFLYVKEYIIERRFLYTFHIKVYTSHGLLVCICIQDQERVYNGCVYMLGFLCIHDISLVYISLVYMTIHFSGVSFSQNFSKSSEIATLEKCIHFSNVAFFKKSFLGCLYKKWRLRGNRAIFAFHVYISLFSCIHLSLGSIQVVYIYI